jgi:hypothetical protein
MNMNRTDFDTLVSRVANRRHRVLVEHSVQQHIRNGRGFWPALMLDGEMQVVRFASARVAGRWTAETGSIDVVPVNQLSPLDLPRVHFIN